MSMILLDLQQGSREWLEARAGVITASRFSDARAKLKRATDGRAAGEPHGSALKYAWTIAMERIHGAPLDDTFQTWAMRRGHEEEPNARMAYELRTGALVETAGLALTEDRLFGYSTDGFVEDDGMVEIKVPAACDKLGECWLHPEAAHEEYIDQIDGGLWITRRKWCDLVIYCPWLASVGKDLFIKRIWRDDDRIESLEKDLWAFNKMVASYQTALTSATPGMFELGYPKGNPVEPPPWEEPTVITKPPLPAKSLPPVLPAASTTALPELF